MKLKRIAFILAKFYNASSVRAALGEDFRKVGTASVGVGVVAFFIPQVNATFLAPLSLALFGLTLWAMGLALTHSGELRAKQEAQDKPPQEQEKDHG